MFDNFISILVITFAIIITAVLIYSRLSAPSRRYQGPESVSQIYDHWAQERILERIWGGHLHVGYYGDPPVKKDFIAAKIDLIDEIVNWGIATPAPEIFARLEQQEMSTDDRVKVLDAGCGLGGTTRYLAGRWPNSAHVTGITISHKQVERATDLAQEQGLENAVFLHQDATQMDFPENSFDIIWALESEPHIPDKAGFVEELMRVLKPGGVLVIAAWNVRDTRQAPLSKKEQKNLQFVVDEWCHARFISIPEYIEILQHRELVKVRAVDWTRHTLPSWRAAVLTPFRKPGEMIQTMPFHVGLMLRDGYTFLRLDAAFRSGLCQYGLLSACKEA